MIKDKVIASAVIVVYALLMRFLMLWPDPFLVKEILRYMGALVPITLVMTDVIKNNGGHNNSFRYLFLLVSNAQSSKEKIRTCFM